VTAFGEFCPLGAIAYYGQCFEINKRSPNFWGQFFTTEKYINYDKNGLRYTLAVFS
jgi:hypothetical protein